MNPAILSGLVIHGNHLGSKLGFPTANIQIANEILNLYKNGVYACEVLHGLKRFKGIANLGFRPTIGDQTLTLEVHLFDFSGNLYGESLQVTLLNRIRGEKKFSGLEELAKQIGKDILAAKKLLG